MTWKLLFISLGDLEASFTHPSDTEASITPLVMRKSFFLFLVDAEPIGDTEASFTPQSDTEASFYTAFVSNFILSFLTYLLAS